MLLKRVGFTIVLLLLLAACPAVSDREWNFPVGHVVINEILYRLPAGRDLEEWVELYNSSDQRVNLRGWTLDDRDRHRFTFADDLVLAPGAYVLVATNAEQAHLLTEQPDCACVAYQTAAGRPLNLQIWNNDGDEILLTDAEGRIVDYVAFGNPAGPGRDRHPEDAQWDGNIPTPPAGYSLALFPNGYDMDSSANWSFRPPDALTPGGRNK